MRERIRLLTIVIVIPPIVGIRTLLAKQHTVIYIIIVFIQIGTIVLRNQASVESIFQIIEEILAIDFWQSLTNTRHIFRNIVVRTVETHLHCFLSTCVNLCHLIDGAILIGITQAVNEDAYLLTKVVKV